MNASTTLADVIRAGLPAYRERFGAPHHHAARAIRAITDCRTPAMGGLRYQCSECGHQRPRYHSCRNRNCPTCQTAKRLQWIEARTRELLPVGYFHVVFTLPAQLRPFALRNQAVFYRLMFQAASATLLQLGADQKRLGAQLGLVAVLHTWGQNLMDHPHIHCIVPGGGIDERGKWLPARQSFLFPVAVMRALYRGKLLAGLKEALADGRIGLHGTLSEYQQPGRLKELFDSLYTMPWVVYCKAPFASAQAVVKYLGRYTHRVAISNQRILSLQDGQVSFAYKDYADCDKRKVMTLSAGEFLRRFLMHVVPRGFVRIRHFGFLANRNRKTKLAACLSFFGSRKPAEPVSPRRNAVTPAWVRIIKELTGRDPRTCPLCTHGMMLPLCPIPRLTG
jgi:hypothetical protein